MVVETWVGQVHKMVLYRVKDRDNISTQKEKDNKHHSHK